MLDYVGKVGGDGWTLNDAIFPVIAKRWPERSEAEFMSAFGQEAAKPKLCGQFYESSWLKLRRRTSVFVVVFALRRSYLAQLF
jgi:hypothetical protein